MAHEALGNLSEREREREVLYLIATRQMTNRQVADRLSIEESTVATHVHSILKTTHTHNRHEAARLWLDDYGLDRPPGMAMS